MNTHLNIQPNFNIHAYGSDHPCATICSWIGRQVSGYSLNLATQNMMCRGGTGKFTCEQAKLTINSSLQLVSYCESDESFKSRMRQFCIFFAKKLLTLDMMFYQEVEMEFLFMMAIVIHQDYQLNNMGWKIYSNMNKNQTKGLAIIARDNIAPLCSRRFTIGTKIIKIVEESEISTQKGELFRFGGYILTRLSVGGNIQESVCIRKQKKRKKSRTCEKTVYKNTIMEMVLCNHIVNNDGSTEDVSFINVHLKSGQRYNINTNHAIIGGDFNDKLKDIDRFEVYGSVEFISNINYYPQRRKYMRNSTLVGALKNNPPHQVCVQLIRWLVLGWDNPTITPLQALNCNSYRSLMANWYIDRHNNNTQWESHHRWMDLVQQALNCDFVSIMREIYYMDFINNLESENLINNPSNMQIARYLLKNTQSRSPYKLYCFQGARAVREYACSPSGVLVIEDRII
uniref:Endonuclease/exonuclease/phosphatase domain-containing protein n=1 Tax=Megaviridae environmental sample TaxID=1737588 RepID=A0A5J6VK11_9VIRU|nr:MAG: hypothetical protein [Megaviridae environmental sample]